MIKAPQRFLPLVLVLSPVLLVAGRAHAQTSPDAESRFRAGVTHLSEGRTELAAEEFKQAVKQDPKNPYFHKGLGQAYAAQNKLKDAIEEFHKALELNPYYVDVHNDLGTVLILSGKREEGKKEFLTAFNDPTNPTPELTARNLGKAHFDERNWTEALSWFRTSMQRNKAYPDAHLGLADTLVASGKLDEAIGQLEIAAEAIPDDPSVLVALGEVYYRAGRFSEARPRLEQVARKDPAGVSGRRATELLKTFPK